MTRFYDLSERIRCSVMGAIEAAGCAAPSKSYVSVGGVAWDSCDQLTVGVAGRVYRSVSFPNEYRGEERCFDGYLAVPLAIVLTRCVPTLTDRGTAPTDEQMAEAHARVYADAAVVWNHIEAGTLPDDEWERANVSQEFVGPLGGIIAIDTRVTIGVGHEVWC